MQNNALNTNYNETILAEIEHATDTSSETDVEEQVKTPWRLFLYDDDIHTFDEVIEQLIKAVGCSYSQADKLTWQVHNEGKAMVLEGEFEECLRADSILKEIQLVTEIKG
ncbi:MAG: ATP-dependent Clp protease adaptor ClpS [Balneolaceae bacterium]